MDELMEALLKGKKFNRYHAVFIAEAVDAAIKSEEFAAQCGTFGVEILTDMIADLQIEKAKGCRGVLADFTQG